MNRVLLKDFIEMCIALLENEEITKMTVKNIAISFGPSLSRATVRESMNTSGMEQALEVMMLNFDMIFVCSVLCLSSSCSRDLSTRLLR